MYRDQAIFVTAKIQATVKHILQTSSTPPFIILQADHGYGEDFGDIDGPGVPQRASILNAYYFPHGCDRYLYLSITPVNTFRVLFNCHVGASYPLLADTTYWSPPPWVDDFQFVPINDRLER